MSQSIDRREQGLALDVDESPIEIKELTLGDATYRPAPPLHFSVTYATKDELYDLQGDFGIVTWEESRTGLEAALYEELDLLWTNYAQTDPSCLSSGARKLRKEIRTRLGVGDALEAR